MAVWMDRRKYNTFVHNYQLCRHKKLPVLWFTCKNHQLTGKLCQLTARSVKLLAEAAVWQWQGVHFSQHHEVENHFHSQVYSTGLPLKLALLLQPGVRGYTLHAGGEQEYTWVHSDTLCFWSLNWSTFFILKLLYSFDTSSLGTSERLRGMFSKKFGLVNSIFWKGEPLK